MIELGMIRHVKDEHDFSDETLFYRTNYVPYEKKRSKKGYLEKRPGSGALKLFEKRWFELANGELSYYTAQNKASLKGSISLYYDDDHPSLAGANLIAELWTKVPASAPADSPPTRE